MRTRTWMILTGMVIALVALMAFSPAAYAQGRGQNPNPGQCSGANYVDENGDGICDNAGQGAQSQCSGANYVDENGDGICDNAGQGQGTGANYVDENGDGICDNAGQGRQGRGRGNGNGQGMNQP